jgi:predicted metal-binding membrane protein
MMMLLAVTGMMSLIWVAVLGAKLRLVRVKTAIGKRHAHSNI